MLIVALIIKIEILMSPIPWQLFKLHLLLKINQKFQNISVDLVVKQFSELLIFKAAN